VFEAGAVNNVLPLSQMAEFICTVCRERAEKSDETR
jgi:hypothetical protein